MEVAPRNLNWFEYFIYNKENIAKYFISNKENNKIVTNIKTARIKSHTYI